MLLVRSSPYEPHDETVWIDRAILKALRDAGWIARYTRTLPGVTYDTRDDRLYAMLKCGEHTIYLGAALPTWENEVRLSRMWEAARATYQTGGDVEAIRTAARETGNGS